MPRAITPFDSLRGQVSRLQFRCRSLESQLSHFDTDKSRAIELADLGWSNYWISRYLGLPIAKVRKLTR